ncbi:MAG: (Na+)-NQR maturation NqrM, partial [Vibrio sp.]
TVAGSCGGLGAVGVDKVCNCPEPCDARKKREAKEALRQEKLAKWKQDSII